MYVETPAIQGLPTGENSVNSAVCKLWANTADAGTHSVAFPAAFSGAAAPHRPYHPRISISVP